MFRFTSLVVLLLSFAATTAFGQAANEATSGDTYDIAYKFQEGERFHTKVVHLVTIETTIKGTTQVAKTRSVSTKTWKILKVHENGNITFVHSVDNVDMQQSLSGREDVRYNSLTDKTPPPGYEMVASAVAVPLATVTMDRHGRVLERKDTHAQFNPGIGELTIPLPPKPVKPGAKWSIPDEVKLKQDNGQVKKIQTLQVYKLEKVETGVATITLETQVVTPLNDPKLRSELVQRLQHGTIRFDIDAGHLLSKQLDMSETVIGFNGADSRLEFLARFTEEPSDGLGTAAAPREEKSR